MISALFAKIRYCFTVSDFVNWQTWISSHTKKVQQNASLDRRDVFVSLCYDQMLRYIVSSTSARSGCGLLLEECRAISIVSKSKRKVTTPFAKQRILIAAQLLSATAGGWQTSGFGGS